MAIVKDGGRGPDTKIFVNRADRIPLELPIAFTYSEGKIRGKSLNISESGILATFDRQLDVWLTGQLSILLPEHPIFVETRIARVDGKIVAMSFRNMRPRDRLIIQTLLKAASDEGAQAV
jgi:hypothetical protein